MRDKAKMGCFDLESLEMCIRSSMHTMGGKMLEQLLNSDNGGGRVPRRRGDSSEFKEYRDKKLVTVLGPIKVKRAYYYDKEHREGLCPKDKDLDIKGTSFSPGVRRMLARVGAYRPFALGHADIEELAGIRIDTKEVERSSNESGRQVEAFNRQEREIALSGKIVPMKNIPIMYICADGTGVPVVKKEVAGRKGKGAGGVAKTREAKLGCVFTQTTVDEKGSPVRDEGSTTYVGAIETAEVFADRIYGEAVRRGINRAQKVCILGDGAPWIWNIADEQFYGATQIIDLFHAREHYWNAARIAFRSDKKKQDRWAAQRKKELDLGAVEKVVKAIQGLPYTKEEEKEIFEKEAGYFEKNKERMRYQAFREQGFFVGSGVLEAGCRTVIGQRLKQSGMHWTVEGANNIIALRSCFLSNQWEDFWESRLEA